MRGKYRGYRGGRHMGAGGGGERSNSMASKPTILHQPFDLDCVSQEIFKRVDEVNMEEEDGLKESLVQRNNDLTPTPQEQTAVVNLVSKVQTAVETLIAAPPKNFDLLVDEVKQVGSFKKGTMMAGKNTADVLIILKMKPTLQVVASLGQKIVEIMKSVKSTDPKDMLTLLPGESGVLVKSPSACVRLLIACIPPYMKLLEPDLHLPYKELQLNLSMVRHAKWFEDYASHSNIKILVRLMKDLRERFLGLQPLNPWMVELLAHHCVMKAPSPLPIDKAFLRTLRLLASGLFLPGSMGVIDPCEFGQKRIHTDLSLEDQDMVCYTSQTLLRVLLHGGFKHMLGFVGATTIDREMSIWKGIVVTPSDQAYDKDSEETGVTELMQTV